jgi:hypothetical protein
MMHAALALVSTLVLSSPAPTTKRTGILLIPMDKGAESQIVKLESFMLEALEQFPSAVVKKTDELLGLPPDDEAEAALKRAEGGFHEGKAAFEAREWEDAERKLRADIKEFYKASAAMKGCGDLCEAMAMYAASLQQRGDQEEAKLTLIDLIALSPTFEFDAKKFSHEFLVLRTQVATGHTAALRGSVSVKSRPEGARVYVDGEFQGFAPAAIAALPVGRHFLRVERPGFKVYGQMMEVSPEDSEVLAELKPTSQYKTYDAQLDKVAAEVTRDQGGTAIAGTGKALGLDRAFLGTVKEINESGGLEVLLGLFDMKSGRRIVWKKVVYQGDEYGQLKSEIGRLVNGLYNSAEGGAEKVAKSSDPLDGHHGMEEWGSEDKGKKGSQPKKKAKDPLDGVNGTEDW